jgi:hypothetical protein
MEINTQYYNYYNVKGRYTPDTPQTPDWKKRYAVVDDRVKSNNYSQDSDDYKAHVTLEEAYYAACVSNREKYSSVVDLEAALAQKYLLSDTYSGYSMEERMAMSENEENMSVLGKYQLSFSIDPYNYSLKVTGTGNSDLKQTLEKLLNENNNSRELFYYILQSSRGSVSKNALLKYHALRSFASVTGEDPRDYKLTEDGLVNEKGQNILDVYKKALETSDAVPSGYKGAAYSTFADNISELLSKDFINIPALNLSIGYSNGMLQNLTNESVMQERFQALA